MEKRSSNNQNRAVWLKRLHQWHWISSAICLLAMLLFSITGITLNHATQIDTVAKITNRKAKIPAPLQADLQAFAARHDGAKAPVPPELQQWLQQTWSIGESEGPAEWTTDEVYVALPRPGGDAWVRVSLPDGAVEYELTDRGWISWLNDLHKGRHTGKVWYWFIDVFAVACLFFAVTGLVILQFHAKNRPSTWPIVGLGVLLPILIALFFIH